MAFLLVNRFLIITTARARVRLKMIAVLGFKQGFQLFRVKLFRPIKMQLKLITSLSKASTSSFQAFLVVVFIIQSIQITFELF